MSLLYLDFDGALPADLMQRIVRFGRIVSWRIRAVRIDKTARGFHVVVDVARRLSPLTIVASQAILGSDRNRETFNLDRARKLHRVPAEWRNQWNVLYHSHNRAYIPQSRSA